MCARREADSTTNPIPKVLRGVNDRNRFFVRRLPHMVGYIGLQHKQLSTSVAAVEMTQYRYRPGADALGWRPLRSIGSRRMPRLQSRSPLSQPT
jgi:hypothetical protein